MTLAETPLHKIAAEYPTALGVFDRFEIDLCRMGEQSLAEACAELHLSADQVQEKIFGLASLSELSGDPEELTLAQLIQRIVRVHHRRIRQDLPALAEMATRLEQSYSEQQPEHAPLARLVSQLHRDLFTHIGREEQVLFPFIALMEEESRLSYPAEHTRFRALSTPIDRMLQDHDDASQILDELRQRTNGFAPPLNACAIKQALYAGLKLFDIDTREHVHLENDVVFPRAIALESELVKKVQPKFESGSLS